jgi:PIN domain nuclease of toxin-antitoxin system
VAMEMEQQQTNCQEEGKQKCSNVLNFTSTHFFSLTRAPLIAKMARIAINKRRMKKRQKICGSLSQHVLFNSTIDSFGNKDDRRGERN